MAFRGAGSDQRPNGQRGAMTQGRRAEFLKKAYISKVIRPLITEN
jgi:hypothetical protein